ncbi:MAG: SDR family oxidoreductase [Tildeniella nuda ZEHNDER 1965/U140]|jgi:NAD(P)-dependent dehydrogenase (short-subunit alcohol dehydrogenase family)|nr:SDR family oxidoreductase [Tildeniella nuda ZEHNDER 1965/U140]
MLLSSKNVLVFAATGAIGSEVARKFAREGAQVWVSGRNAEALEKLVSQITDAGGTAKADVVDATDPATVSDYVTRIAATAGSLDAVFNGIGGRPVDLGYPEPATTVALSQFLKPLQIILGSTFLTSRTVGAQMMQQGSGAIVTLSATLSSMTAANMAGISATCGAIEAMTRSLAGEFGRAGVRVNCVRGSAMPETRTIQETMAGQIQIFGEMPPMSLPPLGRPISVAETAATAAFLASDAASGMTGQVVTVCAGAFVG